MSVAIANESTTFYNGSTWTNKAGVPFKIIGKSSRSDEDKNKVAYYLCQFDDGTILDVRYMHIIDGQVKNPHTPSVCGVGYLGQGEWKSVINYKRTKEYNTWIRIINACYNVKYKDYLRYGAKGVTVEMSWHNFQNFCSDIQQLSGYSDWKLGNYQLDKDILCEQLGVYPKVYSKTTCAFISPHENNSYSHRKKVYGVD